jgi:hypothetical protein
MFTFKKKNLRKQRGMHLCDACFDTVLEIEPVNVKWRSARDNGTSIAPVTTPTTFSVAASAALTVSRSQTKTREGVVNNYEMMVAGATGVVYINSISAMPQGAILTLQGTSDTNIVFIPARTGLDLVDGGAGLANGSTMTLVYNAAANTWIETSRMLTVPYHPIGAGPSLYNDDFVYNFDVAYTGV